MIGANVTSLLRCSRRCPDLENYARSKGLLPASGRQPATSLRALGQATPTATGLSDPAGTFSKIFNDYGTINTLQLHHHGWRID